MPQKYLVILPTVLMVACGDGHLRDFIHPSTDGKTYLAIADDNGGGCGPIRLDGNQWTYQLNEQGEITPGVHTIECGGEIEFEVPDGVVFSFDYWGP